MSKIKCNLVSIEFKLITGADKKYFNEVEEYEFISAMAEQDVSVSLTKTECNRIKRLVNLRLDVNDECFLKAFFKKISKQIDISNE